MSIIESIINWVEKDLLDWQSDVVRRLLTQKELSEEDESEVFSLIKGLYGLNNGNVQSVEPRPLKKSDIINNRSQSMKITLKAMDNLQNVNAIPDGSALLFAHEGLSVIYGENGAGKSGYARVLKRACNARDSKERIISNVFQNKSSGTAQANFRFSLNDKQDEEVLWKDKKEIESPLSNINVFDSKSANIIVDGNNEVIYLPEGAQVFEGLVSLMKRLKTDLEHEKPVIIKLNYKDIDISTEAGQIIEQINHTTKVEKIESFAIWDDANEAELVKLSRDVTSLVLNDPLKQANKIRNLKDRIKNLTEKIEEIETAFSIESTDKLKDAIDKFNEAEKAVELISQNNQIDAPLQGIGENAWQTLYNAAKDYSIQLAYPTERFPVVGSDSRCVFCMQTLSEDAKDRLKSFMEFMENTTKQKERIALESLEVWDEYFKQITIPSLDSIKDILDEVRDKDENINLEGFVSAAETRVAEMIKIISKKQKPEFSLMIQSPKQDLIKIVEQLENEAKEKEKYAVPDAIKEMDNKVKELRAKKYFTQRKKEILEYQDQLKRIHRYEECIEQLSTNAITRKGKSIVSSALTPKLTQALESELRGLGVPHLPLSLKPSGSGGETRHQISFPIASKKAKLSEILSEGEQRIVALAGFFAELKLGEHECPIVFDDPVSSLDHRYREKIAERLVKESLNRQVVIFTHDIAFLLALETKSGESVEDVCFFPQTVRRIGECSGNLTNTKPWHAMSVGKRISYLKNELNNFKKYFKSDIEIFNEEAAKCYGLLRETWESLIEEALFNKTVHRHSPSIHTQRLKAVEVTNDYIKRIDLGMRKCSKWMIGHDKSNSLDISRPLPDEIEKDIKEIEELKKEIEARGKVIKKEREVALKPKVSPIG